MSFGVTSYSNGAVGIMSANIISINQSLSGLSAYTTLGIQTYRYDLYYGNAQTIDQKIQPNYLDPGSTKKNQILDIGDSDTFLSHPQYYASGAAAESAASTLYGQASEIQTDGVSADVTSYISLSATYPTPVTYTAGDAVTGSDGTSFGTVAFTTSLVQSGIAYTGEYAVKDWNESAGVGIGSTMIASGITTNVTAIQYIGVSKVYDDFIAVTYYPNLEPPGDGTSNPFQGRQTKNFESVSDGIGAGNTFYGNSIVGTTYANYVDSVDILPYLGDALVFDTSSNTGGATSITNLRSDLSTNRSGISSYVDASTKVKGQKNSASINIQSLKRAAVIIENQKSELQSTINVLNDPTFQ